MEEGGGRARKVRARKERGRGMKRERGGIVEGEGGEAKGVGKANEEEMREGRRAKD